MPRRLLASLIVALLPLAGCGGGSGDGNDAAFTAQAKAIETTAPAPSTTPTEPAQETTALADPGSCRVRLTAPATGRSVEWTGRGGAAATLVSAWLDPATRAAGGFEFLLSCAAGADRSVSIGRTALTAESDVGMGPATYPVIRGARAGAMEMLLAVPGTTGEWITEGGTLTVTRFDQQAIDATLEASAVSAEDPTRTVVVAATFAFRCPAQPGFAC